MPDLQTSTTAWLIAGGPHHTVLSTALIREHLQDFSDMAAVELAFIDESTTTARPSQELRWNSAYYRLAQACEWQANPALSTPCWSVLNPLNRIIPGLVTSTIAHA
jgi:hypothetical protein